MYDSTRSFIRTRPVVGAALLAGFATAVGTPAMGPPIDPTRPSTAPSWEARVDLPAIDVTNPAATATTPVPGHGLVSAITPQIVEADVTRTGSGVDYAALVLDSDGTDNVFVKVQDNDGDGNFDHIFFYHGNNGGAWPGMTGGPFNITLGSQEEFSTGHMKLTHDGAGSVTLDLTNLDGGTPSLSHTRGGWTPLDGVGYGMGFFSGGCTLDDWDVFYSSDGTVCDTFNRSNGPLGADWATQFGNAFVMGNEASGTGSALVTYVGDCNGGIQTVEADVSVVGTSNAFVALVLNSDGQDNLFIKLQEQEGGGQFDNIGFYHAVNAGSWPGLTGGPAFFSIDPGDRFSSAHMKVVLYPGGVVRLLITNRDTGGGLLEYQRGGWTVCSGNNPGIGAWQTTGYLDDFAVNGVPICDNFNRPDGPLGPNWSTDAGAIVIDGSRARADSGIPSRSLFIGGCQGFCPTDITGDGVTDILDLLALLGGWGSCP